eukprot:TRINITY_DN357_c0_g1_i4.p1 TRINITY_DN357_c0_g1~~TRINITY_DN357_c0_g1_i4.p1  ORF type:complete len:143 (+),score=45.31 TRINITY_DN357_c0_g1_i4:70-498(+)
MNNNKMNWNKKIETTNPGNLNSWLTSNGGYSNGDLIIWDSVSALGPISLYAYTGSLSSSTLRSYLDSCMPVVANVRSGSHWVLLTGYTSSSTFLVNDPGFNQNTYSYSDMSWFVVYKYGKFASEQLKGCQEKRALLETAKLA